MKFEIETMKLNNLLLKASRGLGKSEVFPVTEYFQLEINDGDLYVTATDMTNFITAIALNVSGDDGEIIVKADQLLKLVAKTTKPFMKFDFDGATFQVTGNGKYKLPVFEGDEFPEWEFGDAPEMKIQTALLKDVFAINKSAIANDNVMPCLTAYNVGSDCVTTDGVKMCINQSPIFNEQRMLITQTLADLLGTITAETVTIQKDENKLLFTTPDVIVFGTELAGLEEYPNINGILGIEYEHHVVLPKFELVNVLDRLSIFVDKFDNNGVRLQFTSDKLQIEDLKRNSNESVDYQERNGYDNIIEIVVNIEFLVDLLRVTKGDSVHIYFGEGLPVKLVEDKVTKVLSTMTVG